MTADPGRHTLYATDTEGGTVAMIDTAACNAGSTHGCPRQPAPAIRPTGPHASPTWSFGGHSNPLFACDGILTAYQAGLPAGPFIRNSVQVAAGSAGGLRWSLWARKGHAAPYGIEQGGVVLNGRWYGLCSGPLSAGPGGDFGLIDTGSRRVVYGYIQHPQPVAIGLSSGGQLPHPASVRRGGLTFFISRLPRSACAYHSVTLKATAIAGPLWSGHAYQQFGSCVRGRLVNRTGGNGGWGPGLGN